MEARTDNTIVIIPSYNESRTIGNIVKDIVRKGLRVLVIDDGSADNTGEVARQNGAVVIQHKHNVGKGFSVREGIKYVFDKPEFEWVMIMDGDGQHHTGDVLAMMKATQQKELDFVIGNRMLQTQTMPFARYWTNRFMSWVVSDICKQRIPDTQCGYRLIRTSAFKKMKLTSKKYDIESEMLIQAAENKMRIGSVPIQTIYGEEVSAINPIRDTLKFFTLILKYHFIVRTLILIIKGGVIGIANIIPGVSGGTLAVILGIYDKLIESIADFFKNPDKRKEYICFLLKIVIGAAAAIGLLANVMDYSLKHHFYKTIFLFMGLILGGIPAVINSHGDMRIRTTRILAFVLGMIIVLGMSLGGDEQIAKSIIGSANAIVFDREACLMILLAGFLAGGAMIVPGISGSFILVLLGQYAIIISAIKNFAVEPIAFMAVGAIAGILVFSKIIGICLKKIPAVTYYFILGLICASFYKIFPGIPEERITMMLSGGTFLIGAGTSYLLSKVSA